MEDSKGAASRATKLLKDLLLAVFNATMVLVIIACVSVIVLLNKIDGFSKGVAQNAMSSAIESVGLSPNQTFKKIEDLSSTMKKLNTTLKAKKSPISTATQQATNLQVGASVPAQSPQDLTIEQLSTQINDLTKAVKEFKDKKDLFTDNAIKKIGTTFSDSLIRVRDCKPAT